MKSLKLKFLNSLFSVCQLEKNSPVPLWVQSGEFYSIVGTQNELSIVCPSENVPTTINSVPGWIKSEDSWRCFRVEGALDFSLTGILYSIAKPLQKNAISIFAVSTFDTDYVLIKDEQVEKTMKVLESAGFLLIPPEIPYI